VAPDLEPGGQHSLRPDHPLGCLGRIPGGAE
jgi:hypothetical protein